MQIRKLWSCDRHLLPADGYQISKEPLSSPVLDHCAKHSSEITASSGRSEKKKILPGIFCPRALYLESKEHLNLSGLLMVALKSTLLLPVEMNAFDVPALQRNAASS